MRFWKRGGEWREKEVCGRRFWERDGGDPREPYSTSSLSPFGVTLRALLMSIAVHV